MQGAAYMKFFTDLLQKIHNDTQDMPFNDLIREHRDRLGLMQYRAAEHLGMKLNRLRNLETGYFRDMPRDAELDALAMVYEIERKVLEKKAIEHVQKHTVNKKVRILDGKPTPMLHLRKC